MSSCSDTLYFATPDCLIEYLGTAVMEVETGEIEMEGDYVRAAEVDIIKGKEVNMYNIVVDKVMVIRERERDNVVYWKTKRKINDDLQ